VDILRKVFKQTVWQIIGKIATALSTLFILRLVTSNYGTYGTGIFTLALTYLSYFALIVDFGLNATTLQDFTKDKSVSSWRRLLGLRLLHSSWLFILALILVLVWPNGEPTFKQLVYVGAFASIFQTAITISANAIFQYKLRYDLSTISIVAGVIFTVLIAVPVASASLPLPSLMAAFVVGWIIMALISLFFTQKFVDSLKPIFDLTYSKEMFKKVWPISLTMVLNVIYFRFDAFVLTFLKGFSEVGIYNVAYQVFQSALVVPAYIMNGFYPVMLETFSQDKKKFTRILLKACGIMFCLGLLGTLTTLVLAPFVISLIAKNGAFSGSVISLQILSLGFPAFFVSSVLMWTLVTMKKYRAMIIIYFIGLIFNVTMNLIFIPTYSYIASSFITGISEYLILIIQILILWKEFR
jgi:O-antigen/teichoic acid export membrane protein